MKTYNLLDELLLLSAMLDLTAQLFPLPTNGRRLKKTILGSKGSLAFPDLKSEEILLGLATTEHSASFDLDDLSLRERATRMMAQDPTAGCVLLGELFRASLNSIGDEILKALILAMRPEDAFLFGVNQQQFLPALFRVNSALATSEQLWRVAKDRKRELFESLTAQQEIAESEQLRDEAWLILQPLVPELSWRKNWDKCERLRRALMSAFMRYSWPALQLRERIGDRNVTEQLLKSARKVDAERYFRNV